MPRASRLEAELRKAYPNVTVELIESGGGVFEVTVDGRLVHSKKRTGRHVEWEELKGKLATDPERG